MISFVISLAALVFGYLIYGRIVERIIAPDDRPTPAVAQADGVDYIVLPPWKVFMIQFLNIAGTGPIYGLFSVAFLQVLSTTIFVVCSLCDTKEHLFRSSSASI